MHSEVCVLTDMVNNLIWLVMNKIKEQDFLGSKSS